jgi:hypothetical protein
VQVVDQLVVQATVGLVCAMHRDEAQDPAVVVAQHPGVDQVLLHGPMGSDGVPVDEVP